MPNLDDILNEGDNDATTIAALAKLADGHMPVAMIDHPDGRGFAITRSDFTVTEITPFNKAEVYQPKLVTQAVKVQRAESLIDYLNRFSNDHSLVFADINANRIMGVVDYHHAPEAKGPDAIETEPATTAEPSVPTARLGVHTVTLDLPFSKEWQTWNTKNGNLMSHLEFADFLEENAIDITKPVGADLLNICRDLHITDDAVFKSVVRDGDNVSVSFERQTDARTTKGNISLPSEFDIRIPVYFNEEPVAFKCLTRRKIKDGHVSLGYKILRLEHSRQREFQRIVRAVGDFTELTTIYGTR